MNNQQDTGLLIFELRRLTGLTWDHLAKLFKTDRQNIHYWASGRPLNTSNKEKLNRILTTIHTIDRGNASENKAVLFQEHQRLIPFNLLADSQYEEVIALVGIGPGRIKPKLSPLSPEEQVARAPLPPEILSNALQETVHRDVRLNDPKF